MRVKLFIDCVYQKKIEMDIIPRQGETFVFTDENYTEWCKVSRVEWHNDPVTGNYVNLFLD